MKVPSDGGQGLVDKSTGGLSPKKAFTCWRCPGIRTYGFTTLCLTGIRPCTIPLFVLYLLYNMPEFVLEKVIHNLKQLTIPWMNAYFYINKITSGRLNKLLNLQGKQLCFVFISLIGSFRSERLHCPFCRLVVAKYY